MAKEKINDAANQENIEAAVSKTEQFYNENKKTLLTILAAIIVVGLAILAYNKFIYQPKCAEAMEQAYPAEASFQAGNFEIALKGDGNALGFEQIISDYGTKAGKAVYMYAGVSALQFGDYESAVSYLKKYNGKDEILKARALSCLGDAYVGLENYDQAAAAYMQAAGVIDNVYAAEYLLKAGTVYEKLGQNDKAAGCYNTIKDNYPQAIECAEIDKYITRATIK